jgi:hypothetical protein
LFEKRKKEKENRSKPIGDVARRRSSERRVTFETPARSLSDLPRKIENINPDQFSAHSVTPSPSIFCTVKQYFSNLLFCNYIQVINISMIFSDSVTAAGAGEPLRSASCLLVFGRHSFASFACYFRNRGLFAELVAGQMASAAWRDRME